MTLVDGAAAQLRVVHALALRETKTRFGTHRLGYLWALLEPAFWIGTFYALYALAGRHTPGGMDLVPFLAVGIVSYELFSKTADRGSAAIGANKALLFYPHVHTIDLIAARTVLEAATYVMVFVVIVGAHALAVQELVVDSLLRTLWGMALASLLGATLGLVLCSLTVVSPTVERMKGPLMRPLFWISGLFFTAESLPSRARDVLLWNPVMHCVEIVRDGWFPQYTARHASASYVLAWIVALAFAGLTLERAVRRKVEVT